MPTKVLYSTSATADGGRDGNARSADGALQVKLVTPKEMGGAGGEGTNPEQLFAAGYAACFLSALKLMASQAKVKLPAEAAITAAVDIGPNEAGGFELAVTLRANLPGLDEAVANDLLAKAHAVCPYSNATRGNINVDLALA